MFCCLCEKKPNTTHRRPQGGHLVEDQRDAAVPAIGSEAAQLAARPFLAAQPSLSPHTSGGVQRNVALVRREGSPGISEVPTTDGHRPGSKSETALAGGGRSWKPRRPGRGRPRGRARSGIVCKETCIHPNVRIFESVESEDFFCLDLFVCLVMSIGRINNMKALVRDCRRGQIRRTASVGAELRQRPSQRAASCRNGPRGHGDRRRGPGVLLRGNRVVRPLRAIHPPPPPGRTVAKTGRGDAAAGDGHNRRGGRECLRP